MPAARWRSAPLVHLDPDHAGLRMPIARQHDLEIGLDHVLAVAPGEAVVADPVLVGIDALPQRYVEALLRLPREKAALDRHVHGDGLVGREEQDVVAAGGDRLAELHYRERLRPRSEEATAELHSR